MKSNSWYILVVWKNGYVRCNKWIRRIQHHLGILRTKSLGKPSSYWTKGTKWHFNNKQNTSAESYNINFITGLRYEDSGQQFGFFFNQDILERGGLAYVWLPYFSPLFSIGSELDFTQGESNTDRIKNRMETFLFSVDVNSF